MSALKLIKVYYHKNCHDGFGSAYAAWTYYGSNAEYFPISYGTSDKEADKGCLVYFLDISPTKEQLKELVDNGNQIIIIDHHKTAWENLASYPSITSIQDIPTLSDSVRVKFNMKKSGAGLAWEFFHPITRTPALLEYIEDRDLWIFDKELSKIVYAFLVTEEQTFERWNLIANQLETFEGVQNITSQGLAVLRSDDKTIKMISKNARMITIGGHTAIAVNATSHWSEIGNYLLDKHPEASLSATYYDHKEGRKWSLRSRDNGVDVSAIASTFGGGGHVRAAGFFQEKATIDMIQTI